MAEFVHKHKYGNTAEAKKIIQKALDDSGYSEYIEWDGDAFKAADGVGMMLELEGRVTDTEFIIERTGGAFGDKALEECQKIAENLK